MVVGDSWGQLGTVGDIWSGTFGDIRGHLVGDFARGLCSGTLLTRNWRMRIGFAVRRKKEVERGGDELVRK